MLHKVAHGTIFPREDGKVIDEHIGVLHTKTDTFSLAHMSAPPAWIEPAQIAEFDEVVIVIRGTLAVESNEENGGRVLVEEGETCLIDKETRVVYSNASSENFCEYWSLCLPAFRPERTRM